MSIHLDLKYIRLLSPQLSCFKQKDQYLFVFRCPLCGDSEKNKFKTRGNFFRNEGNMFFHCYNCDASQSFEHFLKDRDQSLYNDYVRESLSEKSDVEKFFKPKKKFEVDDPFSGLLKISELMDSSEYKQFVMNRKIPKEYWNKLYLTSRFCSFVNSKLIPNKFSSLEYDEPRLIIPFYNKSNELHALQGRSFKKDSSNKYITIVIDENIPKIYGLDTVNLNKRIVLTEGPIDSMFVENGISTAGGDLSSVLDYKLFDKDQLIICYDNEPRKKETLRKMESVIDQGLRIFLAPDWFEKDFNDTFLKTPLTKAEFQSIIRQNSFKGMEAKLKFSQWRKL